MVDQNAIIEDSRNSITIETATGLGATVVPESSILMAKVGEAMRLNRFAENNVACCIDNNMMALVPRQELLSAAYLRLALTRLTVDVLINPGPIPSLNVQGLRMFSIPLPYLGEQKIIVGGWVRETKKIDSLIGDATKLRKLLLKRRSALITEVVTGRKKV